MSEHLASHGIVVVAVDHYGNAVFTNLFGLPDGGLIPYDPTAVAPYEDRVEDVVFVYTRPVGSRHTDPANRNPAATKYHESKAVMSRSVQRVVQDDVLETRLGPMSTCARCRR